MTDRRAASRIWVLADPRAGTAAQALGIAERLQERLGEPFRSIPLAWGPLARIPWPWPTLAGLAPPVREEIRRAATPALVVSAGRRSAPVALWLGRRGARTVHCMRPGFGIWSFGGGGFDRLVLGRHDLAGTAPPLPRNILPVLGATHRLSQARLAAARTEWAALAELPRPRTALLIGGPVRGEGMDPAAAGELAARVAAGSGSVMATTSRRTGEAATEAVARGLGGSPGRLFRWGDAGPNPFTGFLAWADAVVVTGDSVSMLSEALAVAAPVFVAMPGLDPSAAPRHAALHRSLYEAGQARPFSGFPEPFARAPLDESGRVAAEILAAGLLSGEAPAG
ncbi:mitochondrial fission ELM1 family protein [Roseomonas gilardii subsp. gilardii]|uniref:mitochondrial fission ELM1 family protein n=1 Tax=Roseomonas gilardii TaxID=257708 RepID=UPI001FFB771C|nr:mitochondrial fission ELM1 family protein [Roseomonas gilardii]UPG71773.1 mitochondrial fission ELM1 family protein [Roseomonas gilardii subsp. gilardii]